jgi:ATP-dependent DNA helicase RecG
LFLTRDELITRLEKPEWRDLECKKAQHGVSEDAFRTVSAFANTTGGVLVFGVKDTHGQLEIVGVAEPDKVQNDFLSALRTGDKLNRIIGVREDRFEYDGKTLLVFTIVEALRSEKPVYLRGDIRQSYIRRGAGDEQCTRTEIERFLRDAAAERFDSLAVEYDPAKCFDPHSLAWYRSRYEARPNNRQYPGVPDEEFLFQLGLIRETPQGRRPTNAAILLFAPDGYLRGLLPRPIADCQRFAFPFGANPPGVRWVDRVVMESNIIQAWLAFVDWYMKFSSVPFRLDPMTMERDDTPPDFVAFRESFVNVLCHQDYQDHTRKPEIRHFTDRTIFWNPGDAFAAGDLLQPGPKEVRNPAIAIAFRRIGFSENAGWGLNDVIANWTKLGHARPGIHNDTAGKFFEVTLMAAETQVAEQVEAPVEAQVAAQVTAQVAAQVAAQVVEYCVEPKSAKEIMAMLNLKHWKTFQTNYLIPLLHDGVLERTIPDKPNSRMQKYQVTEKGRGV